MDWDSLIWADKQLLLWFNGSESLFLDSLVTTLTAAQTWIPLYVALFFIVVRNNDTMFRVMAIVGCALCCVLLAGTVDDTIVKPLIARLRPTRDPDIGILVDVVDGYRGGQYGFFSAHAANTFSIAVFFSLLIRSGVLTTALIAWSMVNCWTRLYLGVHYPGDILVGLLWGGLVGTALWYLYYRTTQSHQASRHYISSQLTSTGYQTADANLCVLVLLLTLVYAIVRACI